MELSVQTELTRERGIGGASEPPQPEDFATEPCTPPAGAGFATPTDNKKRKMPTDAYPEGLVLAGERVVMWNIKEQRKISGNAAPMIKNLKGYLKRHPDRAVFSGQDELVDRSARTASRALAMLAKAVGAEPPAPPAPRVAAEPVAASDVESQLSDEPLDDEHGLMGGDKFATSFYKSGRSPSPSLMHAPAPHYPLDDFVLNMESECDGDAPAPDDGGDDDEEPRSPPASPSLFLNDVEWPTSYDAPSSGSADGKRTDSHESTAHTISSSYGGVWEQATAPGGLRTRGLPLAPSLALDQKTKMSIHSHSCRVSTVVDEIFRSLPVLA
ncbi:hypothetical protein T492DRAFT_1007573 [Pavlovales sp. CCMP2436]|nr:hypothetical protein T492DRAFT_1007573 [Pavlovales sp. CCMP2436]